jgi:hypothetical protein
MARGGCRFEDLCNGSCKSYACDELIDIIRTEDGHAPTIREAEQMLLKHIDNCIKRIEKGRGRKLEYFYIGKTYVDKKSRVAFDHMDRATWNLGGGINGRWRSHRRKEYGQDGLVVLTVVTEKAIRLKVRKNRSNFRQEDYALVLESRLIQDYMTDPRLSNETWKPGRRSRKTHVGYALYMAFKVHSLCKLLKYG